MDRLMAFWRMSVACDGVRTGWLCVCGELELIVREAEDTGV
jgi:hypothetical protein